MFVGTGTARKPLERGASRVLRTDGMPIKRIARALGVSPSSVHAWTRDIALTAEQREHNLRGPRGPVNPDVIAARAAAWQLRNREKRKAYQKEGRERARSSDPLYLAGCMLYWAEGSKSRNDVRLTNSDPDLVKLFCRFLTESLSVPTAGITLRLNVYLNNGLAIEEIEAYWLELLDLDRGCLRKHSIDSMPTSSSGQRTNRLPYGVCTVSVYSTRIVQHIFGAIQEYAGFEQPRWLD